MIAIDAEQLTHRTSQRLAKNLHQLREHLNECRFVRLIRLIYNGSAASQEAGAAQEIRLVSQRL